MNLHQGSKAMPESPNHRKGHYLGTEIDEKWWKRYRKDKFFARGNGTYWFDDTTFYFHRYVTRHPLQIPFAKIMEVKMGNSHAGRWLIGSPVMKLIWEKDGIKLSSGFAVARNQQETELVIAELKHRLA